jgi:DNA-binding transcriptional regulator YiaG
MNTCNRCQRDKVYAIIVDDSIEACGHTFTAQLPAAKCGACGQIVIQGDDIKQFELRVAVELAKAGNRSAEAFRLVRKAAGLPPEALAALLDVAPEFIGYWERGEWPVDPRAHGVLASLLIGQADGNHASLDCLRVLREPRTMARRVRLHLTDALAQATKALQFGSAAFTAPATA